RKHAFLNLLRRRSSSQVFVVDLLLQNRNARRSHDSTRQNDDPATIHFSDEFATESTHSDMGKR
ncbi:hypothetical protein A2U01_0037818, partial [Trifolium medium]|nr:hypothetical protein [Trifolium medium]